MDGFDGYEEKFVEKLEYIHNNQFQDKRIKMRNDKKIGKKEIIRTYITVLLIVVLSIFMFDKPETVRFIVLCVIFSLGVYPICWILWNKYSNHKRKKEIRILLVVFSSICMLVLHFVTKLLIK